MINFRRPGKRTHFEWRMIEDDREWQQLQKAAQMGLLPPSTRENTRRFRLQAIVTGVLLILITGYGLWYERQLQWEATRAELQAALASTPGETATNQQPAVEIYEVTIEGDIALVQAHRPASTPNNRTQRYRNTTFLRRTSIGWEPITPDPRVWGELQRHETEYIRYQFRSRDAAVVTAVADAVDSFYTKMSQALGAPPATEKLLIEIDVAQPLQPDMHLTQQGSRLVVPTPALISAPLEYDEATILKQMLLLLIGETLLDRLDATIEQKPENLTWLSLKRALRFWVIDQTGGPLAATNRHVVQWLYTHAPTGMSKVTMLPADTAEHVCEIYAVWQLSPLLLSIPVTCPVAGAQRYPFMQLPAQLNHLVQPLNLEQTAENNPAYYLFTDHRSKELALATVFDYIVSVYGAEHFARFLHEFSQHKSWETLIPTVFGIPVPEFEQGWQAYLSRQYLQHAKEERP